MLSVELRPTPLAMRQGVVSGFLAIHYVVATLSSQTHPAHLREFAVSP